MPYVVDPRGFFARKDRFPDAEEVFVGWPDEAFAPLGGIDRATSIAVLTHDPKLDDAALEIALRSEAAYVGAMGSRRAQAKRRERLLAKGITDEELARLAAPIGLDLGALTPEETALSIMAEVVALRRGRAGGRLANARGRIHEVTGERRSRDRRPRARGGRGAPVRITQAARGARRRRPCSQHAIDAMLAVPSLDRVVVVLGAVAEEIAAAVTVRERRARRVPRTGRRGWPRRCAAASPRSRRPTGRWSRSATCPA